MFYSNQGSGQEAATSGCFYSQYGEEEPLKTANTCTQHRTLPFPLACTHQHHTTWRKLVRLLYSPNMEAWRWFSYFPSQVTAKLDKRQLYNWVWPELRHRHSQSGGCLAEFLSLTWSLDLLQEEFVASVTNVYGTNVTRRAVGTKDKSMWYKLCSESTDQVLFSSVLWRADFYMETSFHKTSFAFCSRMNEDSSYQHWIRHASNV